MREVEMRHVSQPVEFRAGGDKSPGTLDGYAIKWNRFSQNLGGFVEQVDPASVRKSLADNAPVVARFNHDDNFVLGTTGAGTLHLEADEVGLRYIVPLPNTTAGRDVAELAKRGDLRHSSFAFHTIEDEWGVTDSGFPLRTLRSIQLVDVAPVISPAYLDSTVGVRSLAAAVGMDVDAVKAAAPEEIRSILNGEEVSDVETRSDEQEERESEQVENHSAAARLRLVEFLEKYSRD